MPNTKHLLASTVAVAVLAPSFAMAAVLAPDLSIVGTETIDDSDGDLTTASNTYSAGAYRVVGGVNIAGESLLESLTDTGDGFGHTASLSGDSTSKTVLGGEYEINATNNSADTYKLTFGITFSHSADADAGDLDARAVSELEVEEDGVPVVERLFSRLTSESGKDYYDAGNPTWQDQVHDETSDTYQGTWGDLLSFGETRYFDVTLAGGGTVDIFADFQLDGRIWDTGASYDLTSSMFLFIDGFENLSGPRPVIPEPSTLVIWSVLAVLGMAVARRRRKTA